MKLQRDAAPEDQLLFSIVGWHSLTLPQNPKTLSVARRELLAALLAIGLDPKRSVIFHQDEVSASVPHPRIVILTQMPEPTSYRLGVAVQLLDATGKAKKNDNMEGVQY